MNAALPHDALLPRQPGGLLPGAMLALLVHGGLIAALTLGVDWRRHNDDVFSAELWSALPEVAAPRAPEPVPAPPPPPPPTVAPSPPAPPPGPSAADIALEKERVRARQAAEDLAQKQALAKLAADAKKAQQAQQAQQARDAAAAEAADQKRLEAQRQENLKRLLAQAGGTGPATSSGSAARDAAPSNAYAGVLIEHIRKEIYMPDLDRLPKSLVAVVEVRSTATGTVLSRRLVKASGNSDWDEAVLRAIDRTRKLPRDTDGRVPTAIEISFVPR
jgi:colicin import membrane protein